ncbi:hypothetical protein FS749_000736 [Ceratobasidium sp. UAMH 11750]|nr:hypothetical protein FS749_000736 [Ceratobasidium sp. UAMH 11750]
MAFITSADDPGGSTRQKRRHRIPSKRLSQALLQHQTAPLVCALEPVSKQVKASRTRSLPPIRRARLETRRRRSKLRTPVKRLRIEGAPFANMLDAVADLYNQSEPVIIPWDTWGYGTSWLDTSNLHTGNECFVYGQRVVTTGVNNDDEDEEDMPQKRTLVLLDFDPARASTRNNLFDPERETILTAPFEEDRLWNMFLGEGAECKANARFAIQTARIGQQLNSAFYVMIDDEHSKHCSFRQLDCSDNCSSRSCIGKYLIYNSNWFY